VLVSVPLATQQNCPQQTEYLQPFSTFLQYLLTFVNVRLLKLLFMLAQARILSDITFKVNNVLVNVEININVNQCFISIVH